MATVLFVGIILVVGLIILVTIIWIIFAQRSAPPNIDFPSPGPRLSHVPSLPPVPTLPK
jgi:hypothetical protein